MSAPMQDKLKQFVLLLLAIHLFFTVKNSIATDFYCFSGNLNNRILLLNISCQNRYSQPVTTTPITEEIRPSVRNNTFTTTSELLLETSTVIPDQNETSTSDNSLLTTPSGSLLETNSTGNSSIQISDHINNVTSCYIFKYIEETLSVAVHELNIQANFSCDFQGLCDGKSKDRRNNVTLDNGQKGDLYCCTTPGCNSPELLPDIPPRQHLCYQSSNKTHQDHAAVSIVDCLMPNTACARKRLPSQPLSTAEYFCDNNYLCQHHNLMTDTGSCENVTINNKVWELCCCTKNKCYKPSVDDERDMEPEHLHGYQIGAIAGAVITALVILIALVCVLRKYVCHCGQKEADQGPVTMLYKRLAANVPEDTADVEMLLA